MTGVSIINALLIGFIWWVTIVPTLTGILIAKGKKKELKEFCEFNFCNFFLLNIHLANMPLGYLSMVLLPRQFTLWDLWGTYIICWTYFVFYLVCVDSKGLPMYIILCPRTHFCFISYFGILGAMTLIYYLLGGSFDTNTVYN